MLYVPVALDRRVGHAVGRAPQPAAVLGQPDQLLGDAAALRLLQGVLGNLHHLGVGQGRPALGTVDVYDPEIEAWVPFLGGKWAIGGN